MMNTNVAMELNMDELNTVAGGSIYGDFCDMVDDFCEWVNDTVGEEIFHGPRRQQHAPCF